MRYSQLFTRTKKLSPKDEVTKNAQLLQRAGFVNKLMSGVYSYLPLGLRVLKKIENIIRVEMNAINGQEVFLPSLHPSTNWKKTNGWKNIDVLFKIKSRSGKDYALGQSHEEVIAPLIKEYVNSYKDLPLAVYQIQNKYRDELRSKSGVLRGIEFGMKDMYSFHLTQEDFEKFYEIVKKSYLKIFKRCGLSAKTTQASGGGFTQKISYEFMVLTDAGEDDILFCSNCNYCINVEIAKIKQGSICPKCKKAKLKKARASEAGNVFDLGQKYSKDFDFYVLNKNGKKVYPFMGCYGIGTTRLLGTIVEKYNDELGICWPKSVAPFKVHLITIGRGGEISKRGESLYKELEKENIEVFWDDRINISAGEKLADADLIGIPIRLIISKESGSKIEFKQRTKKEKQLLSTNQVIKRIKE
jgi:prolyl-tRNA synthetase